METFTTLGVEYTSPEQSFICTFIFESVFYTDMITFTIPRDILFHVLKHLPIAIKIHKLIIYMG